MQNWRDNARMGETGVIAHNNRPGLPALMKICIAQTANAVGELGVKGYRTQMELFAKMGNA